MLNIFLLKYIKHNLFFISFFIIFNFILFFALISFLSYNKHIFSFLLSYNLLFFILKLNVKTNKLFNY